MNINLGYRGMIQPSTTVRTQLVSPSAFMRLNNTSVQMISHTGGRSSQNLLKQMTSSNASVGTAIDAAAPRKMTWGEPTWLLFHTMSHKVNETTFPQIRAELLNIIYSICVNLPCPDCAEHAKAYLDKIMFSTAIMTKQDLKNALFVFRNTLNKKKGFPIFAHSELDAKYSRAVTIDIIYNFMYSFEKKSKSVRMIANDNHRSRIAEMVKTWFNNNIKYFDA